MQRMLMLATAAVALGAAAPAFAANNNGDGNAQQVVNNAAHAVRDAEQNSRIAELMKHAKGVFVIPSYSQGALIIGASGGEGVLLVREHGTWSDPAFYSVGSVSFGAQAGGKAGEVVMLLMTDKAVHDFENARNFSLNGNVGLTIANFSAQANTGSNKDDVIVWSNVTGAEAGAKIGGNGLGRDQNMDQSYYGKSLTTAQILQGQANNPKADKLRNALPG